MVADLPMQKFNDDLLLGPEDQEAARRSFPAMFHVLDDDELRTLFQTYDKPANRAKKRSLRAGILAVVLVVIALFGTSAGHIYEILHFSPYTVAFLAVLSALLGFVGVLIGLFGLMIGHAKNEWLYNRMAGELLRQCHFQVFVCRTTEIIASLKSDAVRNEFRDQQKKWLSLLRLNVLSHLEAKFHALLKHEEGTWLRPAWSTLSEAQLAMLPEEFFEAYRVLRITHQQQYADWKLRNGQMIFTGFSLRSLETLLAGGSVLATICLLVIEALIIVPLTIVQSTELPSVEAASTSISWAHWAAICFAILALGMRTLEEGLQPKREIERYQRYSSLIQDILKRFEAGTRAVKFEAMMEMEKLAYEEMREFLRSFYESRFIM